MKKIYCDSETTGLSRWDRIIEIALVAEDGEVLLSTLINPGRKIAADASAIHGITDADVADKPTWGELEPRILEIVRGAELVCHNAAFDLRFMGKVRDAVALVTCTLKMAKTVLGRSIKLGAAAELCGHVATGAWHRATADALACRSFHRWLVTQQPMQPELTPVSIPAAPPSLVPARSVTPCAADDPRLIRIDPSLCPEASLRGKPWTPDSDDALLGLWQGGKGILDILPVIPRTPLALFMRLEKLGAIPANTNPYSVA